MCHITLIILVTIITIIAMITIITTIATITTITIITIITIIAMFNCICSASPAFGGPPLYKDPCLATRTHYRKAAPRPGHRSNVPLKGVSVGTKIDLPLRKLFGCISCGTGFHRLHLHLHVMSRLPANLTHRLQQCKAKRLDDAQCARVNPLPHEYPDHPVELGRTWEARNAPAHQPQPPSNAFATAELPHALLPISTSVAKFFWTSGCVNSPYHNPYIYIHIYIHTCFHFPLCLYNPKIYPIIAVSMFASVIPIQP